MTVVNKNVLRLSDFLPYRISVLANRTSQALANKYQGEFQITRQQWRVIAVLGEESNLSAAQVVVRTAMDTVAVSRAVNTLKDTKLIKQQVDKKDKRRSVLKLSAKGQRTYNAIVPIAAAYEDKIMRQLTKKEQTTLTALLTKLDGIDLEP